MSASAESVPCTYESAFADEADVAGPELPESLLRPADPVVPLHERDIVTTIRTADGPVDDPFDLPPSQLLHASGTPVVDLADTVRAQIAINVIHDGRVIPRRFLTCHGSPVPVAEIEGLYTRERDWGASLVAAELAGALGLDGFLHVNLARVLMDFGRFPGLTPPNANYMERLAVNSPFAQWLSYQENRQLLEHWYDRISDHMDRAIGRRGLTIGVHTYDVYNDSGTLRPEVSILNRALSYQTLNRMPIGLFDPLYPDRLGEFTCDRVLPSRISLHLERAGLPVALNYPYCLPEGSVEVRSQVWHFFDWVRRRMAEDVPEVLEDRPFQLVWGMLLDTNLRSAESQSLRSYLHMFRTAPRGKKREFAAARKAYERIRNFVQADKGRLIDEYRFDQGRPGAVGIEVRKDLVWELDEHGAPVRPRPDNARRIARLVAEAIAYYLTEDRAQRIAYNRNIRSPEPPHDRPPAVG